MEYNTKKYKGKVSSFVRQLADYGRISIEKKLQNKKTPERIEYPFRCTSYSARILSLFADTTHNLTEYRFTRIFVTF
jgi:hypothetical protein